MRGGSDKSGGLGSNGGHGRGATDGFRGGARSPGLPSPNTLLLRSLSSSSAISRVSSHFSHFNSNAAPVELQLPANFRRRGSSVDAEESTRAFGAGGAGGGRDSSGTLDARAARAKYLPSAGEEGSAGEGAAAAENAARAAKSKPQWGWGAGKSIFGKRAPVEVKRSGNTEPDVPHDPPVASTSVLVEVAPTASHARKATDTKAQQGGRRLASETGGTYREPGGERGRGTRSAAEQRSHIDRDGRREVGGGAGVRVRDRRARQSRSVDSPGRVAKGVPASADAAVKAAHGFFSVPAASHADSREGAGGKALQHRQQQRPHLASSESEETAGYERRENAERGNRLGSSPGLKMAVGDTRGTEREGGETRSDPRKRGSPTAAPAGTRRERESSRRPLRATGRTRTRSEERLSETKEGRQWSDLANPRPPLPNPSQALDLVGASVGGGSTLRRTGGGSGGVFASSPAPSSNTTSDKSRASRAMDESSSSTGWAASSLAGWGETMAAEAEAEVVGGRHRGGDRHGGPVKGERSDDRVIDPTLRGQPERTRLHQMVAALTDLCMYLVGVSPLTMEDCPTMLEHLPNDDDDWDEVRTFLCVCKRVARCVPGSLFSHERKAPLKCTKVPGTGHHERETAEGVASDWARFCFLFPPSLVVSSVFGVFFYSWCFVTG